jgi:hypothetical protein
MGEER